MCNRPNIDTSIADEQARQAEEARAREAARRQRIQEGSQAVDAIFDGGRYRAGWENPDTPGIRRVANGGTYDPALVRRIGSASGAELAAARAEMGAATVEDLLSASASGVPTPSFRFMGETYDTRSAARDARQAYINENRTPIMSERFDGMKPLLKAQRASLRGQMIPELMTQRDDARERTELALAERGLNLSSVMDQARADIANRFAKGRADVKSRIGDAVMRTKGQLMDQKGQIKSALRSSADAGAAIEDAVGRMEIIGRTTPQVDPLGDVFWGVGAGAQAVQQGQANDAYRREVERLRPIVYGRASREVS